MKIQFTIVCIAGFALSSCHWGAQKSPEQLTAKVKFADTLQYTDKIVKQRASDCGNKADSDCTVVDIEYPLFAGRDKLNDSVKNNLLGLFAHNDTGLTQLAANFIKTYDKNKGKGDRDMFYTLNLSAFVLNQDSALTTLQINGYQFSGGVHGGAQQTFINWDTKANKAITLNDILVSGFQDQLTKIGEHLFRKQEKLADTATLADSYFFDNDKFTLNDNFLITPQGIKFLYNEYEIKSYAEGMTELLIPYPQIKSLLKPNTVLTQYLK